MRRAILLVAGTATLALGHFVLQVPTSLGFNDELEGTGPCGGLDIASRSNVTNWPLAGGPIQLITTHPDARWEIKAALASDTNTFKSLIPTITQRGIGTFCLPAVPGVAEWTGKDAVIQLTQRAADGALYQASRNLCNLRVLSFVSDTFAVRGCSLC